MRIRLISWLLQLTLGALDSALGKVNWQPFTNLKGVRSFLVMVNYCRRFIRNHGHLRKPLVRLTHRDERFTFGDKEKASFQALKAAVAKEPVLKN